VWPEEDFPLQPVGTLTLDRNIDNFHNESEQIAFNPAATIAGQSAIVKAAAQSSSWVDLQAWRHSTHFNEPDVLIDPPVRGRRWEEIQNRAQTCLVLPMRGN